MIKSPDWLKNLSYQITSNLVANQERLWPRLWPALTHDWLMAVNTVHAVFPTHEETPIYVDFVDIILICGVLTMDLQRGNCSKRNTNLWTSPEAVTDSRDVLDLTQVL